MRYNMDAAQFQSPPKGYFSEQHKKKYTTAVIILGVVFVLIQFVLPLVVMFPMMGLVVGPLFSSHFFQVHQCVAWDRHIWTLKTNAWPLDENANQMRLSRLPLQGGEDFENVVEFPRHNFYLLPDRDRLWLISSSQNAYYQDGSITPVPAKNILGCISRPFIFRNKPAVVEEDPDGYRLMVLEGDEWQNLGALKFHFRDDRFNLSRHLKVLNLDGQTHWFAKFGDTLYYRATVPLDMNDTGAWKALGRVEFDWDAAIIDGRPTCFVTGKVDEQGESLKGYRLEDGKWNRFSKFPIGVGYSWGIFPEEQGNRFSVLMQSFTGTLRLAQINGGAKVNDMKIGSGISFFKWFFLIGMTINLVPYVLVVILVLIVSRLMINNRETAYQAPTGRAVFASLNKRAFASLIDGAIALLPLGLWFVHVFSMDFDRFFSDMPASMFKLWGQIGLYMLWILFFGLIMSYFEGKSGVTPGKWLFKIRVTNTDLNPCGFGRAVLRNLLGMVDAFFGFMVGVILIAFTEKWQRLGDIAAGTIVIDISRGIEPSEDFSFS